MHSETRIMLAGVGGQGTILAAKIVSEAAARAGFDVKMAEIHGMSQRGGSVVSQVVFGAEINSPVHSVNSVDYLVAFEKLEGLRQLSYLKPEGVLLLNELEIYPMPVLNGKAEYPNNIEERISQIGRKYHKVDAHSAAAELGMPQVQNIVLIGALSTFPGLENFPWTDTIELLVKKKFVDINLKAFSAGRMMVRKPQ